MSQRTIECECRNALPVPEAASAPLRCSCGRPALIPPAEEFESRRVLLTAPTLERRTRRLVAAGLLPPHRECAWCGSVHAAPLDIYLVCEPDREPETGANRLLRIPGRTWLDWWDAERIDQYGRENTVPVPLCACAWCARSHRKPKRSKAVWLLSGLAAVGLALASGVLFSGVGVLMWRVLFVALWVGVAWRKSTLATQWQREFKEKLRQVPAYAQLLEEYPHAAVVLPVWVWAGSSPEDDPWPRA